MLIKPELTPKHSLWSPDLIINELASWIDKDNIVISQNNYPDIETAVYDGSSFNVHTGYITGTSGATLSYDEMHLYVTGENGKIGQWDLVTDGVLPVSSATPNYVLDVSAQLSNITGIEFSPDGLFMYLSGATEKTVYKYTLSTAWMINSAVFSGYFVVSQANTLRSIRFNSTMTKMYVLCSPTHTIYQFNLLSANVLPNAGSLADKTCDIGIATLSPRGIFIKGSELFISEASAPSNIFHFGFGVDEDISTLEYTYKFKNFSTPTGDTASTEVFFNQAGTKMYILNYYLHKISPFTVTVNSSNAVSKFIDKSGNNNHVTQNIQAFRPTVASDGSICFAKSRMNMPYNAKSAFFVVKNVNGSFNDAYSCPLAGTAANNKDVFLSQHDYGTAFITVFQYGNKGGASAVVKCDNPSIFNVNDTIIIGNGLNYQVGTVASIQSDGVTMASPLPRSQNVGDYITKNYTISVDGVVSRSGNASINGGCLIPGSNTGNNIPIAGYMPFPNHNEFDIIYFSHSLYTNPAEVPFTWLGSSHIYSGGSTITFANMDLFEMLLLKEEPGPEKRVLMEGYLAHKSKINSKLPTVHPFRYKRPTTLETILSTYYIPGTQQALDGQSGRLNGKTATATQIYALLDALVVTHPTLFTKTTLGKDQSGAYDINKYHFRPSNPKNKILVFDGQHWEWSLESIILYLFFNELLNNHNNNSALSYMFNNTEIISIPVVNPYAFETNGLLGVSNSRGVNLNRNYGPIEIWTNYPEEGKGSAPFSEIETQYVKSIMEANTDALFFMDIHSMSDYTGVGWTTESNKNSLYDPVAPNLIDYLRKYVANSTSLFESNTATSNFPCLTAWGKNALGMKDMLIEFTTGPNESAYTSKYVTDNLAFFGNAIFESIKYCI